MNIRNPLLGFVLFLGLTGVSQKKEDFKKLVEQTNYYLENYNRLDFIGADTYHSVKDLKLSKNDLKEIIKQSDKEKDFSTNRDSISNDILYSFFLEKIRFNFDEILVHKDLEKYDLKALMKNQTDILKSDDNKLYTFWIDEKTGGSYHSRISFLYHTEVKNQWKWDMENADETFNNDGYYNLYTLKTDSDETLYILAGNVRGCGTCIGSYIDVVSVENGGFNHIFSYSVSFRSGWEEQGVSYNPDLKTIYVEYETSDMTTDCYCRSYSDYEDEFRKKCECIFVFNGTTFELVKESWEKINEE